MALNFATLTGGVFGIFGGSTFAESTSMWSDMIDFWVPKLAAILGFGFLIFIHELGHFLAAKACGVQCDRFYLGFGKAIIKKKWGGTEYGIGWIPLGGYVMMLGQDDDPRKLKEETERAKQKTAPMLANPENNDGDHANDVDENAATSGPVAGGNASGEFDPRSYLAKPVWQRMIIISAGVFMNFVAAIFLGAWAYAHGVNEVSPEIGALRAGGGAWEAGLDVGDRIEQIGDEKINNYKDMNIAVTFGPSGTDGDGHAVSVPVAVSRRGVDGQFRTVVLDVTPRIFPGESRARFGTSSSQTPTIAPLGDVLPGYLPQWQRDFYRDFGGRTITAVDVLESASGTVSDSTVQTTGMKTLETRSIHVYADLAKVFARYPERALRFHFAAEGKQPEAMTVVPPVPMMLPIQKNTDAAMVSQVGPIVRVRKNSAAFQAGLQNGDRIIAMDGEPLGDAILFAQKMRQKAFSENPTVKLTVERAATPNTADAAESNEEKSTTAESASVGETTPVGVAATEVTSASDANPTEVPSDTKEATQTETTTLVNTEEVSVTLEPVERFDAPTIAADPTVVMGDPLSIPQLGVALESIVPEGLTHAQFLLPESVEGMDAATWQTKRAELTEQLNVISFADGVSWPCFVELCQQYFPMRTRAVLEGNRPPSTRIEADLVASTTLFQPNHGVTCMPAITLVQAKSCGEAMRYGVDETVTGAGLVFRVLGNIGKLKKDIGGPIAIFKGANDTAAAGLSPYLIFLVMISANLAVLNILPIPALDGGHLVFLLWEGVTGKRPNESVQVALTMIGIALLMTLMFWAIGLDIARLFGLM